MLRPYVVLKRYVQFDEIYSWYCRRYDAVFENKLGFRT